MRLTELQVEGFKKIRLVAFKLRRGITEISGENGSGKSSALDSIAVLIDGLKVAPAKPIRSGAEQALIRGKFGEMTVTRTIERTKRGTHTTSIMFEPVAGRAYPATQRQLSDLIGEHNLDPIDFVNLDTKGKWDALRAFVPGFDFEKCAQEQAADFARRTDVNRVAREARAAAHLILVPEGTPGELIDVDGLVAELAQAGKRNEDIQLRRGNREKVTARIAQLRELNSSREQRFEAFARERSERCGKDVEELLAQIKALEKRIEATRARAEEEVRAKGRELVAEAASALEEADSLQGQLDAAGELPRPSDLEQLRKRIAEASAVNANVGKLREREKHLATATRYEAESETLTAQMAARETAKREAIASAKLPIPGIDFGDGEILYNGEPLEQASTAQKLRVAVARIVALNPDLKLAWVRDASLLDDASYAELERLAQEYDCDILIETVRPIGKDAVVLEDGRLKSAQSESAETAQAGAA